MKKRKKLSTAALLARYQDPLKPSSYQEAPNEVTEANSPEVWDTLYGKKKGKAEDRVRLNEKFGQFKKGYLPGWTEEVFVVKSLRKGRVQTYKD